MTSTLADAQTQYNRSKNLRKNDVEALLEWIKKQPHLPKITELQAILFLHTCNYSSELAKTTIEIFFTCRTLSPDVFQRRNPSSSFLKTVMDLNVITPLPKKTPEGHTIFFIKFVDSNSEKFHLLNELKYYDMVATLSLYQEGICDGHVVLIDLDGMSFGHLTKMSPLVLKKFMYYFQEAMPIVLKQLHILNVSSIMERLMSVLRPLLKDDIVDVMSLHTSVQSLTKFIPLECLPEDYGGCVEPIAILHEKIKEKLTNNSDFFEWEESLVVDESKRIGKLKNDDIFGIDGTFRQLEID